MTSTIRNTPPLGLLGGTFDPVHTGHLRLAEEAREALGLDQVGFIPAGVPPHRATPGSSAEHRLAMTRLAVETNPAFVCDDFEVFSGGRSYTVRTLEHLRERLGPDRPLVWILGADAFFGLHRWHRWTELFDLAHLAVANRPGHAGAGQGWTASLPAELKLFCRQRITRDTGAVQSSPAGRVVPFDMTPLAISATQIRKLVTAGRSARYLLPDSVLDYIGRHSLYS